MSKKKIKKEAPKEYRTVEGDFKQIIVLLLELSEMGDCEMVNMGDWSMEDLMKNTIKKRRAIEHLKTKEGKLKDVPTDVLAEAYSEFKNLYRIAKEL